MDQPFDAHIEVLLDHANTATARRPHVGTCSAKNSLLPALGNPFHLGVRVASQIPFPLSNASESPAVTVIRLHAVIRRRRVEGTLSPLVKDIRMYFQFILHKRCQSLPVSRREREMILVRVTCTRGLFNANPALP
jgi:hypothetical protein